MEALAAELGETIDMALAAVAGMPAAERDILAAAHLLLEATRPDAGDGHQVSTPRCILGEAGREISTPGKAPFMRIPAENLTGVTGWRKSSRSGAAGHCVEVAQLSDGTVAVRNSNHRGDGAIGFTPQEWTAFVAGTRDGEFDL